MEYLIIGLGALGGVALSDGIETTEYYSNPNESMFWKADNQGALHETWAGYTFRYVPAVALVLASVWIASQVAK